MTRPSAAGPPLVTAGTRQSTPRRPRLPDGFPAPVGPPPARPRTPQAARPLIPAQLGICSPATRRPLRRRHGPGEPGKQTSDPGRTALLAGRTPRSARLVAGSDPSPRPRVGWYSRGPAKAQVLSMTGFPSASVPQLAEFTAPADHVAWPKSLPCPRRSTLSAAPTHKGAMRGQMGHFGWWRRILGLRDEGACDASDQRAGDANSSDEQ